MTVTFDKENIKHVQLGNKRIVGVGLPQTANINGILDFDVFPSGYELTYSNHPVNHLHAGKMIYTDAYPEMDKVAIRLSNSYTGRLILLLS